MLEKYSDVLGRNCQWKKEAHISKLPKYLWYALHSLSHHYLIQCNSFTLYSVQMMRFYWKLTPDSMDHAGVPCKILKGVSFPLDLDMYEFCTKDVQDKLKVYRDAEAVKKMSGGKGKTESKNDDSMMEIDDDEKQALQEAMNLSMGGSSSDTTVGLGLPSHFKGKYELFAAVTHKGRGSDSGHYIGWGLQNREKDEWMCYDDSEVHPCKSEHIMELKGGGDYDMAYLLFYRAKMD